MIPVTPDPLTRDNADSWLDQCEEYVITSGDLRTYMERSVEVAKAQNKVLDQLFNL